MSKNFWSRVGLGLFCLLVISACKNNPYPEDLTFEPTGGGTGETGVRQDPTLFLRVQNLMQFVEGEEAIYEISGSSPSGTTRLELFGLPRGAQFNSETGELSWTPDFFAANDPQDASVFHRAYPIQVQLFDGSNNLIFLEQEVTLVVFDSARDMLIWTDAQAELREGVAMVQDVEVLDEDFPGSEISLYSPDLPAGATLERIGNLDGRFRIRYTPPIDFANHSGSSDAQGYYRDINFRVQAIGPRNHVSTKVIQWRIRDTEQTVHVAAPNEVRGDDRVNFTMHLTDQNLEMFPNLDILNRPEEGSFSLRRIQSNRASQSVIFEAVWSDIPPSLLGTTREFQFRACAHQRRPGACTEFTVDIQLDGVRHEGPRFDRSAWPLGSMPSAVVGEAIEARIRIRDPETRAAIRDLDIEVSNPALTVTWDSNTSMLRAESSAAGIFQFNLRARTVYGVEGLESMVVEFKESAPPVPPEVPERLTRAPSMDKGE